MTALMIMKTTVLFLSITIASMVLEAEEPSNMVISNEYAAISSALVESARELFAKSLKDNVHKELFPILKTIAYMRDKDAIPLLLDNLGYTDERPKDQNEFDNTFHHEALGFTQKFQITQALYPCVDVLSRTCLGFDQMKDRIGLYHDTLHANSAITILGNWSAGDYMGKYLSKRKDSPFFESTYREWLRQENMRDASPRMPRLAMKFPTRPQKHQCLTVTVQTYDAMRSTLLTRFSEEKSALCTNLSSTIATMGFIRSLDAIPVLADNLTICPQASTNAPGGFVFPAAEALIAIGPAIGDCFARLKATKPLSVEETLWLRISHELYPEGLEYELYCAARTNDLRAARLMQSLPWRRLTEEDMKDP